MRLPATVWAGAKSTATPPAVSAGAARQPPTLTVPTLLGAVSRPSS